MLRWATPPPPSFRSAWPWVHVRVLCATHTRTRACAHTQVRSALRIQALIPCFVCVCPSQALARESRLRLPELSAQGLANLGWAFAVVDVQGPEMDLLFGDGHFAERCHLVIGKEKAYGTEGSTHMEHLRQLHQWELWRQARSQAAVAAGHTAWPPLHEKLRATCHRVFASRKGRPSQFQRQVLETALSLGMDAEEEVIIEEGYSIDIVLTPSPEGAAKHGAPGTADQAHSLQSKVRAMCVSVYAGTPACVPLCGYVCLQRGWGLC